MLATALLAASGDTSVNILEVNATLLIEIVAFLVLLGLLSVFVFPPIMKAAEGRENQIRDTMAAAEEARRKLAANTEAVTSEVEAAREKARLTLDTTKRQAAEDAERQRHAGRTAAQGELERARAQVAEEADRASREMQSQLVALVTSIAERLAPGDVDEAAVRRVAEEALR